MAESLERVTLGGGCFWCLEPVFLALNGVQSSVSGYAGGTVPNPTYEQVCGKRTGHAEVVQLTFDPAVISFSDILRVFFTMHDPITPNQQGADVGPQYRSIVLTESEQQREMAGAVKAEIEATGVWGRPIVTEIVPLETFWRAEDEHQDYFARNPWSGYCRAVITPKVAKLRKMFGDRLKGPPRLLDRRRWPGRIAGRGVSLSLSAAEVAASAATRGPYTYEQAAPWKSVLAELLQ